MRLSAALQSKFRISFQTTPWGDRSNLPRLSVMSRPSISVPGTRQIPPVPSIYTMCIAAFVDEGLGCRSNQFDPLSRACPACLHACIWCIAHTARPTVRDPRFAYLSECAHRKVVGPYAYCLLNNNLFPCARSERLSSMAPHECAHVPLAGEAEHTEIYAFLSRHAVRQASTKAVRDTMHFMASAFQCVSFR